MAESIGDRGASPWRMGDLFELAVEGGRGIPDGSWGLRPELDEYESSSSSRSRVLYAVCVMLPRAVAPRASSSVLSCVLDLIKEPRSSRIGW